MLFGSHLYGTDTPSSDTDMKSIHIPNASDILLQQVKSEIVLDAREKQEGEKNLPTDKDDKSYSLQAFLNLAAEGQTVAIDMLFAPQFMIEESSGWWRYIVQNRHKLLTKKSAAFLGYCKQQANKYGIKGSRVAASKDSSEIFSSLAHIEGSLAKVMFFEPELRVLCESHPEHMAIVDIPMKRIVGREAKETTERFFECCGRKVPFTASVKQAAEVYTRIFENYGDRARKAQVNEGVDWKALSHAVRVGQEAVELLTTGNVTLPLRNASYIRDIKLGIYPYAEVSDKIEDLLIQVEESAKTSLLPDEVDRKWIDETVSNAYLNRICAEKIDSPSWLLEIYGERPRVDTLLDNISHYRDDLRFDNK